MKHNRWYLPWANLQWLSFKQQFYIHNTSTWSSWGCGVFKCNRSFFWYISMSLKTFTQFIHKAQISILFSHLINHEQFKQQCHSKCVRAVTAIHYLGCSDKSSIIWVTYKQKSQKEQCWAMSENVMISVVSVSFYFAANCKCLHIIEQDDL